MAAFLASETALGPGGGRHLHLSVDEHRKTREVRGLADGREHRLEVGPHVGGELVDVGGLASARGPPQDHGLSLLYAALQSVNCSFFHWFLLWRSSRSVSRPALANSLNFAGSHLSLSCGGMGAVDGEAVVGS